MSYLWSTGGTSRSYDLYSRSELLSLRGKEFGCRVSGTANGFSYSASQYLTVNPNAVVIAPNNIGFGAISAVVAGTQYTLNVKTTSSVSSVYLDLDSNCLTVWPCNKQLFSGSGTTWSLTFDRGVRLSSDAPLTVGYEVGGMQSSGGFRLSSFTLTEKYQIVASVIGTCGCGSISSIGTKLYSQGANVTYFISPDTGFEIESVTVDGINVGTSTTYAFTNISASHTLQVKFKSPPLLPGIIAEFGPPFSGSQGFSVNINNFDSSFIYTFSSSAGTIQTNNAGGVQIVGLDPGASATLTVKSNKSGYLEGTASVSGSAQLGQALQPSFLLGNRNGNVYTVQISNMDSRYTVSATTTIGTVSISEAGLLTLNGLMPGNYASILVTFSRSGYQDGLAQFGVSFGN